MNSSPTVLIVGLGIASLLPFLLVMLTSFVKMAVVLSIVRSALGVSQVPPNAVITGMALVLSLVVMAPVAHQVAGQVMSHQDTWKEGDLDSMLGAAQEASQPVKSFLAANTDHVQYEGFVQLFSEQGEPEDFGEDPTEIQWRALLPAYVVSQLQEAFKMGFVIFLPFLVLDMIVASVLLSLGMHMLSPVTVSLPFKLLLFAMADGWSLVVHSLVGGYMS